MKLIYFFIFITLTQFCKGQKDLLSLKKLLQSPIYLFYNDSLFMIDEEKCERVVPTSLNEVYRLKVYPTNCERRQTDRTIGDYPYYNFNKIDSLIDSLPNLQWLSLERVPLWGFPVKILEIKKLQILNLEIGGSDFVMRTFFKGALPEELYKMPSLKYIFIPDFLIKREKNGEVKMQCWREAWDLYEITIPKESRLKLNKIKEYQKIRDKYDRYSPYRKKRVVNPNCLLNLYDFEDTPIYKK